MTTREYATLIQLVIAYTTVALVGSLLLVYFLKKYLVKHARHVDIPEIKRSSPDIQKRSLHLGQRLVVINCELDELFCPSGLGSIILEGGPEGHGKRDPSNALLSRGNL